MQRVMTAAIALLALWSGVVEAQQFPGYGPPYFSPYPSPYGPYRPQDPSNARGVPPAQLPPAQPARQATTPPPRDPPRARGSPKQSSHQRSPDGNHARTQLPHGPNRLRPTGHSVSPAAAGPGSCPGSRPGSRSGPSPGPSGRPALRISLWFLPRLVPALCSAQPLPLEPARRPARAPRPAPGG